MIQERFKGLSEKIKSGLRKEEKPKYHVPGYVYGKEGYRIDPRFINARRIEHEIPVNPDYEIIKGVALIGNPRLVIHEELAQAPEHAEFYTINQLEDIDFYKRIFMQQVDKSEIVKLYKGKYITSPIEITPIATKLDSFDFIKVQYAYGSQGLIAGQSDGLGVYHTIPQAVHDGKIDISHPAKEYEGLAYVAHVRKPVNLKDIFASPKEVENFSGELSYYSEEARNEKTEDIFRQLLQPQLEKIGEQVEEIREKPIKGILLSPIIPHLQYADSLLKLNPQPEGELLIAASYLV